MKNIISLSRNKIVALPTIAIDNRELAHTLNHKLISLGYILSQKAIDNLSIADASDIVSVYNELVPYLEDRLGVKYQFKTLYSNYPKKTISKDVLEVLENYYKTGIFSNPNNVDIEFDEKKYQVLDLITEDEFKNFFTNLLSINQSLTPNDKSYIKWFVENYGNNLPYPKDIPFKENLVTLFLLGVNVPIKSPTDVMRIAIGLSGGDVSIQPIPSKKIRSSSWSRTMIDNPEREKAKFKKFSRSERKKLLSLLDKKGLDIRDMVSTKGRWVRLGEILHPGEYKNLYPNAFKLFDRIRNEKVKSFAGEVNEAFNVSFEDGCKKLSERGGEFMRRIDSLVRDNISNKKNLETLFKYFTTALNKASNKVIYENIKHFMGRNVETKRNIQTKGSRSLTQVETLAPLPQNIIDDIVSNCIGALKNKFSHLEPLGNVYIDEKLKLIPLPFNMRSSGDTLKPVIRGQAKKWSDFFKTTDPKYIRGYLNWFDKHGSIDLDLSVMLVRKNGGIDTIAFTNTNISGIGYHSGDIIRRQGPCTEYIDLSIKDCKEKYSYALFDCRNFDGVGLNSLDASFGVYGINQPQATKDWQPDADSLNMKLESGFPNVMTSIFDFENETVIHVDLDTNSIPVSSGDTKKLMQAIEELAKPPKVSVYDLISWHVESRPETKKVDSEAHIDTYFKYEDFEASYEQTGLLMGI
jgi:hypothetical protein